ncbi:MAG: glycolate oxidase subunit GlcE [Magnetovibrio sp.]|nr:glycolate oxidase subunit GlcE [Magnetovibrio sp.]
MIETLKPQNADQVLQAVQWAATKTPRPLEIIGHGSKRGLGRAVSAEAILDLSDLSGILLYEPEELVMSAKAGTPLVEIQAALDDAKQILAFEPRGEGALYGTTGGTIGGVFATAQVGPRRPLVGSARDHLLGFHAVSGRGENFKSGGRVVKNVTGFDLSKLMVGSMGTLAVMTEVTFKVLPRPEKSRTLLVFGAEDAGKCMRLAQNSTFEVSGVAHLPQNIARRSAVSYVKDCGRSVTAVRVEGLAQSVEARCQALRALLAPLGAVEELHTTNTQTLWQEIRDVDFFAQDHHIWRLSVPPSEGPAIAENLPKEHFFDWAGGLVWCGVEASDPFDFRGAIHSGHATLMRADEDVRARVPVFQPQPDGLAHVMDRVKSGFDPFGILNPGRLNT